MVSLADFIDAPPSKRAARSQAPDTSVVAIGRWLHILFSDSSPASAARIDRFLWPPVYAIARRLWNTRRPQYRAEVVFRFIRRTDDNAR
jgi:hypothetical protein